ncbi:hypothetical protein H920_15360 [Fukomys damarensis]|uniref:Uncharacterized protein n=1 Tax=Fukomys damarensis TaxID=885580 RepID=A0A091CZ96_FUKDA|nr:hypothetical protein H920_15360 [Fukomys damarensis]
MLAKAKASGSQDLSEHWGHRDRSTSRVKKRPSGRGLVPHEERRKGTKEEGAAEEGRPKDGTVMYPRRETTALCCAVQAGKRRRCVNTEQGTEDGHKSEGWIRSPKYALPSSCTSLTPAYSLCVLPDCCEGKSRSVTLGTTASSAKGLLTTVHT